MTNTKGRPAARLSKAFDSLSPSALAHLGEFYLVLMIRYPPTAHALRQDGAFCHSTPDVAFRHSSPHDAGEVLNVVAGYYPA